MTPSAGAEIVAAGDVNGDAAPDFAVRFIAPGPPVASAVVWYSGLDGVVIRTFVATAQAGVSEGGLADVGDIDGDGVRDVAITTRPASGPMTITLVSGASGLQIFAFATPAAKLVVGCGDVTGDGVPDIVTAIPGGHTAVSYTAPCPPGPSNPNYPWTACTYLTCTPQTGQLSYFSGASGAFHASVFGTPGDPFASAVAALQQGCVGAQGGVVVMSRGGNGSMNGSTGYNPCTSFAAGLRIQGAPSTICVTVVDSGLLTTNYGCLGAVASGGDADGDGAEDVVWVAKSHDYYFGVLQSFGARRRGVYRTDGAVISMVADPAPGTFQPDPNPITGAAFVGQADGLGGDDYAVGSLYAADFFTGMGAAIGSVAAPSNRYFGPPTAIGDFNGDGAKELAFVTISTSFTLPEIWVYSPKTLSSAQILPIDGPCSAPLNFLLTPGLPKLGAPWSIAFSGGPPNAPSLLVASPVTFSPFNVPRPTGGICSPYIDPTALVILELSSLDASGSRNFLSLMPQTPSAAGYTFSLYGAAVPPGDIVITNGWLGVFGY